ncbi:MAG TPA: hypothetical protein VK175_12765 [Leadbetterella sp.]|nr:hypothetical protein [Leadbetterella sp.]
MNILIRISLTIILVLWAILPYYENSIENPQIELLKSIGLWMLAILVSGFLGFVALYCKDIQTCLELINPQNRKMSPKSAWLMFFMPFNFIEDFFIVINLSNSIEAEAKINQKLETIKDFGMVTGIGWCIAQILSFIPNVFGQIVGCLGIILVVFHWIFIKKIIALLK